MSTHQDSKNGITCHTVKCDGYPHTKTNFQTYEEELPDYFSQEDRDLLGPNMMTAYSLPITSVIEALGWIEKNALKKSKNTTTSKTKKRKANSLYYADMHTLANNMIENITESQQFE